MKVYRQGDIRLEQVKGLPKGVEIVGNKLEVIGETGHAHVLETPIYHKDGWEYAVVGSDGVQLTHPQHPDLPLEEGVYRIGHLRNYQERERPTRVFD